MNDEVLYEVRDRIAYLTINRQAKRNSISPGVLLLLDDYLTWAEEDNTIRAVCITGAGDKVFCSGGDLGGMVENRAAGDPQQGYADLIKRMSSFPKPTVARVNGHCLAGGTGFMLACDVVIACDTAKFGTPEVNVGLWPMMIGALIFRNVLKKKAMEMILLGEKLSAQQALEMGMLTRVVPEDQLDSEVESVLSTLRMKSPIGMKIGKVAFYRVADMPFEEALDYLCSQLKVVSTTEDAVEGITAFIEKREPDFKGR